MAFSTWRAYLKHIDWIVSIHPSSVRALPVPSDLADASSSALDFGRSPFSVSMVDTSFSKFWRNVDMVPIKISFKITFLKCSFPNLQRFNFTSEWSRSISKLSPEKIPLLDATQARERSILASIKMLRGSNCSTSSKRNTERRFVYVFVV